MAPTSFAVIISWGSLGAVVPVVLSLHSLQLRQLRLPFSRFIVQSCFSEGVVSNLGIKTRFCNFSVSPQWAGCVVQVLGKYLLIDESL